MLGWGLNSRKTIPLAMKRLMRFIPGVDGLCRVYRLSRSMGCQSHWPFPVPVPFRQGRRLACTCTIRFNGFGLHFALILRLLKEVSKYAVSAPSD